MSPPHPLSALFSVLYSEEVEPPSIKSFTLLHWADYLQQNQSTEQHCTHKKRTLLQQTPFQLKTKLYCTQSHLYAQTAHFLRLRFRSFGFLRTCNVHGLTCFDRRSAEISANDLNFKKWRQLEKKTNAGGDWFVEPCSVILTYEERTTFKFNVALPPQRPH